MAISKDLYLAILSMDAYNRGYGAGIADGGENDPDGLGREGAQIGSATVIDDAQDAEGVAQAAGFYAVAYTMGSGGDVPDELRGRTVISYRGTDNPSTEFDPVSGGADITLGWVAGAGVPTNQTTMAFQFFNTVASSVGAFRSADIVVTGHSLGGGLAA